MAGKLKKSVKSLTVTQSPAEPFLISSRNAHEVSGEERCLVTVRRRLTVIQCMCESLKKCCAQMFTAVH